jgi:hypothetical protein
MTWIKRFYHRVRWAMMSDAEKLLERQRRNREAWSGFAEPKTTGDFFICIFDPMKSAKEGSEKEP